MKWSTPAKPSIGDLRYLQRFAYLPRECSDGQTRWLCAIVEEQIFRPTRGMGRLAGVMGVDWEFVQYHPTSILHSRDLPRRREWPSSPPPRKQ